MLSDSRGFLPCRRACAFSRTMQALILAAFPFFPMGTVFVAPFLILSFKFEMKLLITFQASKGFVACQRLLIEGQARSLQRLYRHGLS